METKKRLIIESFTLEKILQEIQLTCNYGNIASVLHLIIE